VLLLHSGKGGIPTIGSNESDSTFSIIAAVVSADEIIAGDDDDDDVVVVVTSVLLFPTTITDRSFFLAWIIIMLRVAHLIYGIVLLDRAYAVRLVISLTRHITYAVPLGLSSSR